MPTFNTAIISVSTIRAGNPKYEDAVSRVSEVVHGLEKDTGLVPIFINANTGRFRQYSTITMGARGDSYYEYLLKQWLQTGKTVDYLKQDYNLSMTGVRTHEVSSSFVLFAQCFIYNA